MHSLKFIIAVLLPFALAEPSPAEAAPRSTCTVWPTNQQQIYQEDPNTVYGSDTYLFGVNQVYDENEEGKLTPVFNYT
jgi:hypothetical protein